METTMKGILIENVFLREYLLETDKEDILLNLSEVDKERPRKLRGMSVMLKGSFDRRHRIFTPNKIRPLEFDIDAENLDMNEFFDFPDPYAVEFEYSLQRDGIMENMTSN